MDYRKTYSWQNTIALAPQLIRLAEDLPVAEQPGLGQLLRVALVDLAAAVAADLTNPAQARVAAAQRLIALLDIIDKVYPALDTDGVRSSVNTLVTRLTSPDDFVEQLAGPAPVGGAAAEEADDDADAEPQESAKADSATPEPVNPVTTVPVASATNVDVVPVLPDPMVNVPIVPAGAAAVSVPLTPNAESAVSNVQPDSSQ